MIDLEVSVKGFFFLLVIAILLRFAGNKLVPVIMPSGWRKTIAVGWVGGFAGSLIDEFTWQLGPHIAGINITLAISCSALSIILFGLSPFIKILLKQG